MFVLVLKLNYFVILVELSFLNFFSNELDLKYNCSKILISVNYMEQQANNQWRGWNIFFHIN